MVRTLDIKSTWKVLNSIIKGHKKVNNYSDVFNDCGKTFRDKDCIANGFNKFFTNVGSNLAKNIGPPTKEV